MHEKTIENEILEETIGPSGESFGLGSMLHSRFKVQPFLSANNSLGPHVLVKS
jgi:hypothetical protein